jgi:hypothetical protein
MGVAFLSAPERGFGYAFDRLSTSQINSEPKWSCFHYVSETLLLLKAHPINNKNEERFCCSRKILRGIETDIGSTFVKVQFRV